MNTTMWFQPGCCRNNVVVVLECPGKEEMRANRPAVGETGENLCRLLCSLRDSCIHLNLCKRSIEIVNASRIPHFKGAADGKRIKEVEIEANMPFAMSRIDRDEITHVLFFGKKTEKLFNKAEKLNDKICFLCPHLSRLGLVDGRGRYKWPAIKEGASVCQRRIEIIKEFIAKNWNRSGQHIFPMVKTIKT